MTKSFLAAAQSYWAATGADGELPELPEAPLDAFIELVDRAADRPSAFELLDVARDPYPGLAVGDVQEPWRLLWAVQLAQLEAFVNPAVPGITFFVDTVADPEGAHRVYGHADDPADIVEFATISDALHWMAAKVRSIKGELDAKGLAAVEAERSTSLVDAWEEGPTSGRHVLESLLEVPFAEAWDALSRGEWPVVETLRRPFRKKKGHGGWQRAFSLWLVERFLETRVITLPAGVKASELDAAHRDLVRQLASLEEALHTGLVPEIIDQVAESDDERLGELARAWAERYERWRSVSEPPPAEDAVDDDLPFDAAKLAEILLGKKPGDGAAKGKPTDMKRARKEPVRDDDDIAADAMPAEAAEIIDTPFTRKLRAVITESLDQMIRREIVEVEPDQREPLLAELVEAAADSRSAQHMLKQLTRTLVNSDNVEEIYASDDEVSELFRANMGG